MQLSPVELRLQHLGDVVTRLLLNKQLVNPAAQRLGAVAEFCHFSLGRDHTVAGNPMRFHQGRLDLRLDQAWTTKLPARDRKVVTAITWPSSTSPPPVMSRFRNPPA